MNHKDLYKNFLSMHKNSLENIPAAACRKCGGWTSFGGMSQYCDSKEPVMGRIGCTCNGVN
jgi:hypothetical protein